MNEQEDAIRLSKAAQVDPYVTETESIEAVEADVEEISEFEEAGELQEPLTGYALVADLMRRQDDVITQIDELDRRILAMIKEITEAREAEKAVELALLDSENATAPGSLVPARDNGEGAEQPMRRVA